MIIMWKLRLVLTPVVLVAFLGLSQPSLAPEMRI
jgi:hypothetical protein